MIITFKSVHLLLPKLTATQKLVKLLISTVSKEKPYEDIPGPVSVPYFGSAWKYFPVIGEFDSMHLDKVGETLLKRYGPIVRESVGTQKLVHLFHPNDFETVSNVSMKNQIRLSFFCVAQYRNSKPHLYNNIGILPLNGEKWWKIRKIAQKSVSPLKETRFSLHSTDEITKQFVGILGQLGEINDFMFMANRLNMELTFMTLFGERFHCYENGALSLKSPESALIESVLRFNEDVATFDRAQFYWSLPNKKDYDNINNELEFVEKFVIEQMEKIKNRKNLSEDICIAAQMLRDTEFQGKHILPTIIDLLYGGVDTTAITLTFLLYQLGKDSRIQDKVREEAVRLLPNCRDSEITTETLNKSVYLKAVLKENFRLNSLITGQNRLLPESVKLSGYMVPKDCIVILQNYVACRQESNFKDALQFKPERWIKNSSTFEQSHPFIMMPFGMGTRTCVARRRAEQNMMVFLLRVFSEYEVNWFGEEIGCFTPFLCKPDRPLHISFLKKN